MMMMGSASCLPSEEVQELHMYRDAAAAAGDVMISSSLEPNSGNVDNHQYSSSSLLYDLSMLKEKVQSMINLFISTQTTPDSVALEMSTLIQEIIATASSMMFTFQHISLSTITVANNNHSNRHVGAEISDQGFCTNDPTILNWYGNNNCSAFNNSNDELNNGGETERKEVVLVLEDEELSSPTNKYDIIEVDAEDLLAKYTHYCQICGKGFKRDANLRMHMRAHGDEYKTMAALTNPMKKNNNNNSASYPAGKKDCTGNGNPRLARKYSCPQEGCRWNMKHAKFQPLKSMICVKNHYKRSHCPKMYVCKRCNGKKFSVLSDLRSHEKHCGEMKWKCTCGTTFSRKDKLMGHLALFAGHASQPDKTTHQQHSAMSKLYNYNS